MQKVKNEKQLKVLILGGSHRDIPLIKASQKLGYFVITLGDRDYYLGHQFSDKYYRVDFNDLIEVEKIIKDEDIDYLLPGCGEESYLKTVYLANTLNIGNFDSIETAKLIHNKWQFKAFCLSNKVTTPQGCKSSDKTAVNNLTYPLVVKPTNLSGGRGVEIVSNEHQLKKALTKANSLSDEVFLEEYIEGELIAYSIFIKSQQVHYAFTAKDDVYLNKYLISTAYPIQLAETTLIKLKEDVEKIAKKLQLVDGMFHLQVLIKNNTPYIIDVTRRIPGDFFPDLIEQCDNVRYSEAVVKAYTTGIISDEFKSKPAVQNFVIRHCVMPSKNGIYKQLFIDQKLQHKIISRFDLLSLDSTITDYLTAQIAIVFIAIDNCTSDELQNINQLIYPIIETPPTSQSSSNQPEKAKRST